MMIESIQSLPWSFVVVACLTLGLAPFSPPHIYEKLVMLRDGELKKPIDWFDLFFHGIPFGLLFAKLVVLVLF